VPTEQIARSLAFINWTVLTGLAAGSFLAAEVARRFKSDGQKLMVRGFLGIDLFGQSQIWRRLPDTAMNEVTGTVTPQASTGAPVPASKPAPVKR